MNFPIKKTLFCYLHSFIQEPVVTTISTYFHLFARCPMADGICSQAILPERKRRSNIDVSKLKFQNSDFFSDKPYDASMTVAPKLKSTTKINIKIFNISYDVSNQKNYKSVLLVVLVLWK